MAATNVDLCKTEVEKFSLTEYRTDEPNICLSKMLFCRLTVIAWPEKLVQNFMQHVVISPG